MTLEPAGDRTFRKHYIGNLVFELERGKKRNRSFLTRNVMEVLGSHSKRRRQILGQASQSNYDADAIGARPSVHSKQDNSTKTSSARRSLRGPARPGSHPKGAQLTIKPINIRKKLNFREGLKRPEEPPKKRVKREEIPCYCYCAIWDNREGFRSVEPIVKRNQRCTVIQASYDGVPVLDITMDTPFCFEAAELFVPVYSKGISDMGIGDKYTLETKIIPCSSRDPWPIIPVLSKFEGSLVKGDKNQTHPGGYLVSSYVNLPTAPAAEIPMSVALDQDGRTYKTKYGLEVRAHWSRPQPQLDDIFPSRTKHRSPSPRQCPTPKLEPSSYLDLFSTPEIPLVVDDKPPEPCVQVCYKWGLSTSKQSKNDFLPGIFDDFQCYCDKRIFRTLKLLRFHLSSNHDKYTFELEDAGDSNSVSATQRYTFRVRPAPIVRERAANHVKDEREIVWEKPQRPFDIEAYNDGDGSWTGELGIRNRRLRGAAAEVRNPEILSASEVGLVDREKKHYEDTLEISEPRRKRFSIPIARTKNRTSFHRSTSSKKLGTGEELSESDEDVDITWLRERHLTNLSENQSLANAEKEFMCKWDEHIMTEGFPLPRYIADSTVRFTRANLRWLRKPGMLEQFEKHNKTLKTRGIIGQCVMNHCAELIAHTARTPTEDHEQTTPTRIGKGHHDTSSDSVSGHLGIVDSLLRSTYGVCGVCKESTTRRKNLTIYCSSDVS